VRLPRVVVAAAASGQGKTTIAVGLMAALSRAGHVVAGAKVGPDYIDPGYHALATGRPGRNLDPWLQGEARILPLLAYAAGTPTPADLTIIEGVMGLFDGRLGADGWASTAHLAALSASPVLLVIDISSAARTVAALVHGLRSFDARVHVAGVILNKAGSTRHADEVRRSVEQLGLPVLGVLLRDAGVSAPSRHLGLVPAAERPEASAALDRLAEQTAALVDLPAVLDLARAAPEVDTSPWSPWDSVPAGESSGVPGGEPAGVPGRVPGRVGSRVVAVAGGRAFTFRYAETDEILRAHGLEPVVFDPALDTELPAGTSGIYLGGGFPEVHAGALSSNRRLLAQVREAIHSGVPTVAECAGLLYLADAVDGHRMVGAVPTSAAMHPRLMLRYREATAPADTLLAAAGATLRGHEFHRTRTTPGHGDTPAWLFDVGPQGGIDGEVDGRRGGVPEGWSLDPAGLGRPTVHASYLHLHWAGQPQAAARFAAAVRAGLSWSAALGSPPPVALLEPPAASGSEPPAEELPATVDESAEVDPLEHHGDTELAVGLHDFAVNVRLPGPPQWLAQQLRDAVGELGAYPDITAARRALADRHGVSEQHVLPTAGAAEAFVLIARALRPRAPLVVHPQFTEPEAALRRAGITPERLVLERSRGFTLDPTQVPQEADLVIVGNPTNPTGVLHPRATLAALRRPGRTLVVDEAFLDTIAGEADSLIGADLTGLLVLRSLTKMWGVAGVRAGYVVGDPHLLSALARHQPHWAVGSLAATVMVATTTPAAGREAHAAALDLARWRAHLTRGLIGLGLAPIPSATSFVLVEVGVGVRERLRRAGYAVRRGDTFPGLSPAWVRIAVRDPQLTDGLLRELAAILDAQERSA
jgi:cobyrinic acid a,c-diamide synthase